MERQACLLQPVIDESSFSILSPEGELLLYCDPQQLALGEQELDRNTVFAITYGESGLCLKVAGQVWREAEQPWSMDAAAALVGQFHRFGLDVSENFLDAARRGSLFRVETLSKQARDSAVAVCYEHVSWEGDCLVFQVGGTARRWNPLSRRLDGVPIRQIRADRDEQMGDTKYHNYYYLAFDNLVLVERGKQYFERLAKDDPSNDFEVCRAYEWVCDNLRLPCERKRRDWLPEPATAGPPRKPDPVQDFTCLMGCSLVVLGVLWFVYGRFRQAGMPPLSAIAADFYLTWPRWLLLAALSIPAMRAYMLFSATYGPFVIRSTDRSGKPVTYGPGCLAGLPLLGLGFGLMPYLQSQPFNWNGSVVLMALALLATLLACSVDDTPPEEAARYGPGDAKGLMVAVGAAVLALLFWK